MTDRIPDNMTPIPMTSMEGREGVVPYSDRSGGYSKRPGCPFTMLGLLVPVILVLIIVF